MNDKYDTDRAVIYSTPLVRSAPRVGIRDDSGGMGQMEGRFPAGGYTQVALSTLCRHCHQPYTW